MTLELPTWRRTTHRAVGSCLAPAPAGVTRGPELKQVGWRERKALLCRKRIPFPAFTGTATSEQTRPESWGDPPPAAASLAPSLAPSLRPGGHRHTARLAGKEGTSLGPSAAERVRGPGLVKCQAGPRVSGPGEPLEGPQVAPRAQGPNPRTAGQVTVPSPRGSDLPHASPADKEPPWPSPLSPRLRPR